VKNSHLLISSMELYKERNTMQL